MSIASEIQRLQTIKANIRNALVDKGVDASAHNFDLFASDILDIATAHPIFALIQVDFNEGCTVTCSNGVDTFTATGGTRTVFNVPSVGEWTLTKSGGGLPTQISTVTISDKYDVKYVDFKAIYLLHGADRCSSVTGGWVTRAIGVDQSLPGATPSIADYSDHVHVSMSGQRNGAYTTSRSISMAGFSKLVFVYKGYGNWGDRANISAWSSFGNTIATGRVLNAGVGGNNDKIYTGTFDISNQTGYLYVGCYCSGYGSTGWLDLYDIYLTN